MNLPFNFSKQERSGPFNQDFIINLKINQRPGNKKRAEPFGSALPSTDKKI